MQQDIQVEDDATSFDAQEGLNDSNKNIVVAPHVEPPAIRRTWTVTDLSKIQKAAGSKWIFKTKKSEDGEKKFRARLVAQGFTQQ